MSLVKVADDNVADDVISVNTINAVSVIVEGRFKAADFGRESHFDDDVGDLIVLPLEGKVDM